MFQFVKNYRKGRAIEKNLQFASICLAAHISKLYESHADGKLYGFAVWDGLLGEDSSESIQAYRLSHTLEVQHDVDKLMQDDEQLRSIVLLTLFVKAVVYRAHGNKGMSENILSSRLLKQWGYPATLPEPDDYARQVESYLVKYAPQPDGGRAAMGAHECQSFPIGGYKLDARIDVIGLTEFSALEYAIMGRQFEGEKNYNAPPLIFLNREWRLQLGRVNGKIYKIAPFVEFEDRKEADLAMKDTLSFCTEQMGNASKERRGLIFWDTTDGNVVLQPIDKPGFLGVSLFITSNSVRSFKRK